MHEKRQIGRPEKAKIGGLTKGLQVGLEKRLGKGFSVDRILQLSPIMTEARLKDKRSGQFFNARVYQTTETQAEALQKAWLAQGGHLKKSLEKIPPTIHGLKNLSACYGFISSSVAGIDLETYLQLVGTCKAEFVVRTAVYLTSILEAAGR